jgi:hypothetical protein
LTQTTTKAQKGLAFAHVAVILAILAGVYLLAVMLATRLGYISPDLGFRTLTLGLGPKVALGAVAVAVLSLLISIFKCPGRMALWAFAAVIVSGSLVAGFFGFQKALKAFPPIADVATDWDAPLAFSAKLLAARGADALRVEDLPRVPRNESMAWGGKTVADINQLTCPAAKPVFNKAVGAAQIAALLKDEHYTIVSETPEQVEATHVDNFYGFRSDVAVRLQNHRVDIRSVGRYDIPDLGGNCRRVSRLVKLIRAL